MPKKKCSEGGGRGESRMCQRGENADQEESISSVMKALGKRLMLEKKGGPVQEGKAVWSATQAAVRGKEKTGD